MNREYLIKELMLISERMTPEERGEFLKEALLRIPDIDLYTLRLFVCGAQTYDGGAA